jgi:hypothetical protein
MLNLKNIQNSKDKLSIKVVASNRFITSINNNIDNIKGSSAPIPEKQEKIYKIIYKEALKSLLKFAENTDFDENNLHRAAKKFTQALEIRKIHAEPYFFLAFIYNYMGHKEISSRYLQVASFLNPNLPGISELKSFNNRVAKKIIPSNEAIKKPVAKVQPGFTFKPDAPVLRRFPKY